MSGGKRKPQLKVQYM